MRLFDQTLCVPSEELEFLLRERCFVPWADFVLNPRRLRGSDFLMRWSQGVWSEKRIIQAVNETGKCVAIPYGPSGTAPEDPREYELYFERLEKASTANQKRPDILIFRASDEPEVSRLVRSVGGAEELPFTSEDDPRMGELISRSIVGVECENSLWLARQMPDFASQLTPQKWLRGKRGLKKTAVVPTVIVKEEDREPLRNWQREHSRAIHIWHVFYDLAFGISFDRIEKLIRGGLVRATEQVFQAPGGATTRKIIYKVYYRYAYPLGESSEEPNLSPHI